MAGSEKDFTILGIPWRLFQHFCNILSLFMNAFIEKMEKNRKGHLLS